VPLYLPDYFKYWIFLTYFDLFMGGMELKSEKALRLADCFIIYSLYVDRQERPHYASLNPENYSPSKTDLF